jgi:hypothetical protein
MQGFQLKLDFGEGVECQEEYERFLEINNLEDNNSTWAMFCECWKSLLRAEAMLEKRNQPVQ